MVSGITKCRLYSFMIFELIKKMFDLIYKYISGFTMFLTTLFVTNFVFRVTFWLCHSTKFKITVCLSFSFFSETTTIIFLYFSAQFQHWFAYFFNARFLWFIVCVRLNICTWKWFKNLLLEMTKNNARNFEKINCYSSIC